jgi:hypothetical protein
LFVGGGRVFTGQRGRIEEHGFRITESDTVLQGVDSRLPRIPRHPHICILCIPWQNGKDVRVRRSNDSVRPRRLIIAPAGAGRNALFGVCSVVVCVVLQAPSVDPCVATSPSAPTATP